ncbi:hypothetical protein T03_13451 [Trichinella britovi]|uniref:Uncharacterized protein n=1 Tax=Trichinella britovi TaxID=45882 RepID=A0A0V1CD14_TRIBR|nr:hypothetical protein T03_13451 [Trichinella britovi]
MTLLGFCLNSCFVRHRPTTNNCCASLDNEEEEEERSYPARVRCLAFAIYGYGRFVIANKYCILVLCFECQNVTNKACITSETTSHSSVHYVEYRPHFCRLQCELGKRGGRAGSNRTDDTDAEMNPQVNTGASSFVDDCGSNPVEATNEPALESGSLHHIHIM